MAFASIGSFWWVGWWGILVVATVVPVCLWLFILVSGRTYRTALRAPLARVVVEAGVPPRAMVEHIERNKKKLSELDSFRSDIAEDLQLDALYWTTRLDDLRRR